MAITFYCGSGSLFSDGLATVKGSKALPYFEEPIPPHGKGA